MVERRAKRLAPVVDMAERDEREAARLLGQCQGQMTKVQEQLADLERYRDDYQLQWSEQGRQGVTGQWLINYQRFLSQFEVAIDQQRNSLNWHRDNLNKARDHWQQRYARLEGLRKLVLRYLQEARQLDDKREQKLLDELAQRLQRRDAEGDHGF